MQKNRWSDSEIQLIKDVFKNEDFVYAVRDVMMGFTNTFEHKTTDEVLDILRKNLLPMYQPDVPLEMQQDLCQLSLNYISGFNADEGVRRIEAFDIGIDYLERRFCVLLGTEDTGESLDDLKAKGENRFVRMLAYLQVSEYIEKSLNQLVSIANVKELSQEEIRKREQADSSK